MRENELDKPCSDLDLACLACEFTEWERVAPHLGISEAEADEVRHDSKKLTGIKSATYYENGNTSKGLEPHTERSSQFSVS